MADPKEERPLQRRARERRKRDRQQRAAEGTAAMDATKGRSAEHPEAAGGRVDYTPQPPAVEHPPTIEMGTPAKSTPGQIGPTEQILKPQSKAKKKKRYIS